MTDAPLEVCHGDKPDAAVIWLHGLGADGNDFAPIVPELQLPAGLQIRFVFPHAPLRPVSCNGGYVMRAWYDIYSLQDLTREDEDGLQQTRASIEQLIQREVARGIAHERIVLLGFSQGGAAVLHAGLGSAQRLAGIGALSSYLPLQESFSQWAQAANTRTPIFMAHGTHDPVVVHALGIKSRQLLEAQGYAVQWHEYPMEHSVCAEEIGDISAWLGACLQD